MGNVSLAHDSKLAIFLLLNRCSVIHTHDVDMDGEILILVIAHLTVELLDSILQNTGQAM
jgi:hypothetical protein